MLIQSIIERDGGSDIDIGGVVYRFVPDATGKHVCDVENEGDIAILLAIPEGFKVVVEKKTAKKPVKENDTD